MVMHDGSVLHCNIHIWDAVSTEYWPAIVVWSRIELPDTSAHDSGSIDSIESDWERAIDGYLNPYPPPGNSLQDDRIFAK